MTDDTKPIKVEPYVPFYKKGANKFLRFELRPFVDKVGNKATLRIAIFTDKSKNEQEMVAHVMWED